MNLRKRFSLGEFLRFGMVGFSTAVLGWALLYILVSIMGIHYLVAFPMVFLLMNALAYVKAGSFAFRVGQKRDTAGLIRYYGISLISLAANWMLLAILVEKLGIQYMLAVVGLTALNAPLNFLAHRRFTFRMRVVGDDSKRAD